MEYKPSPRRYRKQPVKTSGIVTIASIMTICSPDGIPRYGYLIMEHPWSWDEDQYLKLMYPDTIFMVVEECKCDCSFMSKNPIPDICNLIAKPLKPLMPNSERLHNGSMIIWIGIANSEWTDEDLHNLLDNTLFMAYDKTHPLEVTPYERHTIGIS